MVNIVKIIEINGERCLPEAISVDKTVVLRCGGKRLKRIAGKSGYKELLIRRKRL